MINDPSFEFLRTWANEELKIAKYLREKDAPKPADTVLNPVPIYKNYYELLEDQKE